MGRRKIKNLVPIATLMLLCVAVWSWSFHRLLYTFLNDILGTFGIVGEYMPNLVIVVLLGAVLLLCGNKISELIK